ncbi:unnamed protein product [Rhodiola kirilowii]
METRASTSFLRSLPAIHTSIKLLTESRKVSAMITDLCGTAAFGAAEEFGVPCYVFFTSNALVLSFMYSVRKLMEKRVGEFKDMVAPIKLPGCVAVHGSDLIDSVQVRSNDLYKGTLMLAESYNSAAGILVNSCSELEAGAFKALNDPKLNKPPVYAIGPLVQTGSAAECDADDECLTWLDQQPNRSVVFVSFGSGGTLSQGQMNELAFGLESSGVRFLWVMRSPNDKVASGNYFNNSEDSRDEVLDFLPNGFLERTRDVGLAVSKWVAQVAILGHGAIGGFLTHCGWNSALEGIGQGVPLIAWPLYAEQRMNAALLTDGLGVAIRVRPDVDGVVRQGEIVRCVEGLFEGEELRKRMVEVQWDVLGAMSEGGSSKKSTSEVVKMWKSS